ncbi:MAG: QueT transporter family protein [Oscillospiraceae bacterium]|nr:QueT transporter family protein [Oscillospiraceae bacterium]
MSKKEIFETRNLVRLALVAAIYAAITVAIPGLSFGSIQFRFSEVLVLLCFYRKDYSIALILGCFIANCFSPMALMDMIFGTLATAIAVIPMFYIKNIWVASLLPVVSNGIIVAIELFVCFGNEPPIWFNMITVGAGELVVVTIIGCVLFRLVFERSSRLMEIIGANKPNYFKTKTAEQL